MTPLFNALLDFVCRMTTEGEDDFGIEITPIRKSNKFGNYIHGGFKVKFVDSEAAGKTLDSALRRAVRLEAKSWRDLAKQEPINSFCSKEDRAKNLYAMSKEALSII